MLVTYGCLLTRRLSEEDGDPDAPFAQKKKRKGNRTRRSVPELKAELKALLAEPLMARGVSARYPTSGSKVIVDDLLKNTGESHAGSGFPEPTSRAFYHARREHDESVRRGAQSQAKDGQAETTGAEVVNAIDRVGSSGAPYHVCTLMMHTISHAQET